MKNRLYPSLVALLTLLGGSLFAYAQMGPDDDRRLPYRGHLELNGAVAEGAHAFRFGLFSTPDADASCLLSAVGTCPLWAEERAVEVAGGTFGVTLGDETPLTDEMLAADALYLAMAVSGPADGGAFTLLEGKQEIVPVAYAARAAAAKDYKVTGELVVGDAAGVHVGIADGAIRVVDSTNAARRVVVEDSTVRSESGATPAPLTLSGDPVVAMGDVTVNGTLTVNGAVTSQCAVGWTRVGMWCMEDTLRGATGINFTEAANQCHAQAAAPCPLPALLLCDVVEPAGAACVSVTDSAQWLWTGGSQGNDVSALANQVIFNGNGNNASNERDVTNSNSTVAAGGGIGVFCCRYAGGV